MMRWSSAGRSGLNRAVEVGAPRRMESKITAEVLPLNAMRPVAIS